MSITIKVTTAGRAALVNAANTGTAPVVITQVGLSQAAVTPTAGLTSLTGEFKRLPAVGAAVVADDTIHLTALDESADAYALKSFALYLADGTMFAIYGQAATIIDKASTAFTALALDVTFADIDATLLTFGDTDFQLPVSTTDNPGIIETATTAEAQAGIDALRALTPASAKAAVLGWLLAQDGAGSGLDADLLDGQQGSYYANIPARLGYTPANKAGDTFTAAFGRDSGFYLDLSGTSPMLMFANDGGGADRIEYDRTNNKWSFNIAGNPRFDLSNAAAIFTTSLQVTGGAITRQGFTVWDSGNDGSGSGLDADLLDGQQAAAFALLSGASFTGDVNLVKAGSPRLSLNSIGAVVGSLVAQIDGNIVLYRSVGNGDVPVWSVNSQTGPFNVSMPLRVRGGGNGFVELQTSGNGDSGRIDFLGNDGARKGYIYAPTNATMAYGNDSASGHHFWGGQLRRDGALVWDAANDGHGSGLDADLLDGRHASDFMLASDGSKFGSNGNGYWETRANGFLEQWGTVTQSMTQGWYGHDWPQWFSDPASVNLQITPFNPAGTTSQAGDWWPQVKEVTATGFTMVMQDSSGVSNGAGYHWRAIGK